MYVSGTIRRVASVISKSNHNSPRYRVVIANLYMCQAKGLPEVSELNSLWEPMLLHGLH